MTQDTARRLADELADRFNGHVEIEQVRPGRFRFGVLSKHFVDASHLTRQDQAWEVVERVLTDEQRMDVSLLLMMGPEDVGQELVELMP